MFDLETYLSKLSKGVVNNNEDVKKQIEKFVKADIPIRTHSNGAEPSFYYDNGKVKSVYNDEDCERYLLQKVLGRFPTEHENVRNYRLQTFTSITKDIFNKGFIQFTGSAFGRDFDIDIENKPDVSEYEKHRLLDYFASFIINNPNGYIGIIINNALEYKLTSKSPDVDIAGFTSKNIQSIGTDYLHLKNEKYNVIYTEDEIIMLLNNKGTDKVIMPHNAGEILAWQCGGIPNEFGFYDSYFDQYINNANRLLTAINDDNVVSKYVFPILELTAPACTNCGGNKTVVNDCSCHNLSDGCDKCNNDTSCAVGYITETCSICNGKGVRGYNMGEAYYKQPPDDRTSDYPVARYINPDVGYITKSNDKVKELYEICEKALFITNSSVAKSGESYKYEYEGKYHAYHFIATGIISVHKKALIYKYRLLDVPKKINENTYILGDGVKIEYTPVTQYSVMTDTEIYEDYQKHIGANTDLDLRYMAKLRYLKRKAKGNYIEDKKVDVLFKYSRYNHLTLSEAQSLNALQIITPKDVELVANASNQIEQYFNSIQDYEILKEKSIDQIVEEIKALNT